MTTRIIGILSLIIVLLLTYKAGERNGDKDGYKRGTTEKQIDIDHMVIDHAEALQEATAKVDLANKLLQAERDLRDEQRKLEQVDHQRIAGDLTRTRTERDGLRDQLDTALVTGGRPAGDDTLAACHERASRAGRLLDAGMQLQEALAGRAEACATDLRAMRGAWPKQVIIDGATVRAAQ